MPSLVLLAALAPPLLAGDVALTFKAPGAVETVSVVYPDVETSMIPGLATALPDGTRYMVHLGIELQPDQRVLFDIVVERVEVDRKGRARLEVVSRPRVQADIGESAFLLYAPDPADDTKSLSLEVVYFPAAADPAEPPPVTPAAGPAEIPDEAPATL